MQPAANTPLVGQTAQAVANRLHKTPLLGITTSRLNIEQSVGNTPSSTDASMPLDEVHYYCKVEY